MDSLELFSEPFQATGGVASEGIRNTLGRPTMDLLTLLARETIQNSWDARRDARGGVHYGMSAWNLDSGQRRMLEERIFVNSPPNLRLREELESMPTVLAIHDRGTTGLGGPLRADQLSDEPRDFVDFLRNVGQPPDKEFAGGTFGYGKSSLYIASGAQTILVHSRCRVDGVMESRLMGAALGSQFHRGIDGEERPFTGRHWWGRFAEDGVLDPVLGDDADVIASELGLPGFEGSELGTTILILCPRLEGRTPEAAMRFISEAIVWNLWPKMLPDVTGEPPMDFALSWDGEPIEVPDPLEHPPLHGFVRAMVALGGDGTDKGVQVREIRSRKPSRRLGHLALHRFAFQRSGGRQHEGVRDVESEEVVEPTGEAFSGPAHHVALMRQAKLVVKYLPGPELPTGLVEYGGIFIVDPDVDDAFGRAEPPTHDDWLPKVLGDKRERRHVNVALRDVAAALREFAAPLSGNIAAGAQVPLGAFAEGLASLMPWEEGTGSSIQPISTKGERGGSAGTEGTEGDGTGADLPARAGRGRVEILEGPALGEAGGVMAVLTSFRVNHGAGLETTTVRLRATVAVADGDAAEREPPIGANAPTVLWWRRGDGADLPGKWEVTIPAGDDGPWSVAVRVPADTSLLVDLRASAG
jgi:hypothetical protein